MATFEEEEADGAEADSRAEPEGEAAAPDSVQPRRQHSVGQPLSAKAYAWIALVAGLLGFLLLLFYVFQVPRLVAGGVQNQVFYLLLIPWGLLSAAFLFGTMRSYARYKSTALSHTLELGGPVVLFVLVLVGGFRLVPPAAETFDLTVRAHSADGTVPIITEGEVVIDFGTNRQDKRFGEDGQAHFQEISRRFWGDTVTVIPRVEGYEETSQKKVLTSNVIDLALEPTGDTATQHCSQPTTPVLLSPGENDVVPNHYYGQGEPWEFEWLESSCGGGSVRGYRIRILARGAIVPAVDTVVSEPRYRGDTSGTLGGRNWTWKVQAIDDRNQLSLWSEERSFFVPEWQNP